LLDTSVVIGGVEQLQTLVPEVAAISVITLGELGGVCGWPVIRLCELLARHAFSPFVRRRQLSIREQLHAAGEPQEALGSSRLTPARTLALLSAVGCGLGA
jgi:hypothetical protein